MALLPRLLKFIYYFTIVGAFCANMIVVSQTTTLSVLGAGLALRGPDGSMMTATDGLYEERSSVFRAFGFGLACTVGSLVILVWIILSWEAALICMMLTLYTTRTMWRNYRRVQDRFWYDENETVDFRDIMEGPAAIQGVPWNRKRWNNQSSKSKLSESNKSSSMPLDIDDGSSEESNWGRPSTERLVHRQTDFKNRKGRGDSPSKEMIQTV